MNRVLALIGVSTAALLLSGCVSDEHQDVKHWMDEAGAGIKGRVPPLPEITPFPVVSYEGGALLEPFNGSKIDPNVKEADEGGLKPDLERQREPLEAYPLESLKMVGVMKEKNRIQAVVQADNTVYTVKVGNYMGQSFGRVTRITDTEVQLVELVQDPLGEWVERTTALQLQEQEAGK